MRIARMLLLAACTVACTVKERDQKGPEIHITLDASFQSAGDQDTTNEFRLDTDPSYTVDATITSVDGTEDDSTTFSYFSVTDYHATFAVPNVTIPEVGFTADGFDNDPTFKRDAPFVIPASAKGGKLSVHVEANDSRGLSSNVIDFTVSLN